MTGVFNVPERFAFVRLVVVDDLKKWLLIAQCLPIDRLRTIPAVLVRPAAEVVIRFLEVARVVTGIVQEVRIQSDSVMRNFVVATHRVRSHRDRKHSGNPSVSHRSADWCVGVAVSISKSFAGQLVDIRSARVRIAVASDPVDAIVFGGQPQNVGAFGRVPPCVC